MTGATDVPADVTISLYVRADQGGRHDLVERLEDLESEGRIDSYEVTTWPSRIDASIDTPELRTVEEFEEWADGNDVSLKPGFRRRRLESSFTGETSEVVVLPAVALAVHRDDELRGVAPCTEGSQSLSVDHYLNEIESDEEYLLVSEAPEEAVTAD